MSHPELIQYEYFAGNSRFGASFKTDKHRNGCFAVAVPATGKTHEQCVEEAAQQFAEWERTAEPFWKEPRMSA